MGIARDRWVRDGCWWASRSIRGSVTPALHAIAQPYAGVRARASEKVVAAISTVSIGDRVTSRAIAGNIRCEVVWAKQKLQRGELDDGRRQNCVQDGEETVLPMVREGACSCRSNGDATPRGCRVIKDREFSRNASGNLPWY